MNDLLSNPLIPARDYVAIRINSPAPAGEDENQPPSGQDETNQPAGSSNNGAGSSQEEDDFESLGLLTQYIGPPVATADQTTVHRTNPDEREIDRITAEFKSKYENLVDSLDRAKGHRTSLGQAKQRGRTPAKLQISIRPMVVNRENPEFQGNWERAVKQSEGILLDTLINHLDSLSFSELPLSGLGFCFSVFLTLLEGLLQQGRGSARVYLLDSLPSFLGFISNFLIRRLYEQPKRTKPITIDCIIQITLHKYCTMYSPL